MKTTVEIRDELFARIQARSRREGRTLRSVIEEGLRLYLEAAESTAQPKYELPDESVGDPEAPNPLDSMSWPELRDEIYAGQ